MSRLGIAKPGKKEAIGNSKKPGVARPLIVPRYDEVGVHIILTLLRTAGISREAFFKLLENC